jgi:hypothetical protein
MLLATACFSIGFLCLEAQACFTRWKTDRELDRLAGVFWGWGLFCMAWAVVVAIN